MQTGKHQPKKRWHDNKGHDITDGAGHPYGFRWCEKCQAWKKKVKVINNEKSSPSQYVAV